MRALTQKSPCFHWLFIGAAWASSKLPTGLEIHLDKYVFLFLNGICHFNISADHFEEAGPYVWTDGEKSSLPSELIPVIAHLPLNELELPLREGNFQHLFWGSLLWKLGFL